MATEFGSNITQTPELRSSATPQAGVAKRPVVLEGLNNLFEQAGGLLEKRRAERSQSAISEFTKRQLLVADALDQGRITSSAHARTLMRKNLLEAIDMAPGLAADFIGAQGTILNLPGGAGIVKDGSEEEQMKQRRKQALVDAGAMSWDATDETFRKVDNNIRAAEEASRQHKLRMETLDEELKTGQVTKQRREEIEREKEQITNDLLRSTAPTELNLFEGQMKKIVDSDMTTAEKTTELQRMWSQWQNQATASLGDVGTDKFNQYKTSFEEMYNLYQGLATGEIETDSYTAEYNKVVAKQKALIASNPTFARMAATSEVLGQAGLQDVILQSSDVMSEYVKFIAEGVNPSTRAPTSITSDTESKKAVKGGLKSVTDALNRGDEKAKAEAATMLPRVLQGIVQDAGRIEGEPLAATEVINWMATSDFLNARNQNPELFEQHAAQLGDVLARNYDDEVWAMVRREFTEADVTIMPTGSIKDGSYEMPATSGVGVRGGSSGVEFFAIDPNQREMVEKARRLNKDLKPVINNTLKAGAHLEGRSDYSTVWDEVANEVLGGKGITDIGGGDESDELSLSNFIEAAKPIVNLANSSNLVELIDREEGAGNYDTLYSHSQKGGKDFAGVSVSNMSIGQAINFANGEYGDWSRRQLGYKATPMGRYQIVGTTLQRVAGAMGLDMNTKFDARTQDAMFAFLAQEALGRASTMGGKRRALRAVWEGFKYASDEELNRAIEEFES